MHVNADRQVAPLAQALRTEPRMGLVEPAPLGEADLLRVHTPEHVAAIRSRCR